MRADDEWDFRDFEKGSVIFSVGETGDEAYVIRSGTVDIVVEKQGAQEVVETLGQGDFLGEMALVDDQPRMARAEASAPTTVIVISREIFNQKLQKTDPFIRGLLNIFVDTIRQRD